MARGRKPETITIETALVASDEDIAQMADRIKNVREHEQATALARSQQDAAVRAVAHQLGYQLPADCTDPDLIQRDISANMRRSVEACLEVGRGLRVLKEACEHGQFVARLEVLGLERNVAARFMHAATKFSNAPTSAHLMKAIGNQSKLFEMLVLDDDQVEELELTGQTGELSLDDIATMSVKELRAALREARAEHQAVQEISAEKTAEIERLREERIRIRKQPPDEVQRELAAETAQHVTEAAAKLRTTVRSAFTAMAQHFVEHGGGDCRHVMAGHVAELQRALNELREDFNLRDFEGDGTPEWMNWPGPDGEPAPAAAA